MPGSRSNLARASQKTGESPLPLRQIEKTGFARIDPDELARRVPPSDALRARFSTVNPSLIEKVSQKYWNSQCSLAHRTTLTKTFDQDALLAYAGHSFFIDTIGQYIGVEPRIRYISAWIDYPTKADGPVSTQMFHRDPPHLKQIKTFLYLNDVSELNGPFSYVEGSHKDITRSLPHFRHSDDDVAALYPDAITANVTGRAGSLVIADVNGFHRGLKPVRGYRALLTVFYSGDRPACDDHEGPVIE